MATPFTDEDETTHDEDALLETLTFVPAVTVVPVDTVVLAGAPDAVPRAIRVPAQATAAKASAAANHFIWILSGGFKTPQLLGRYPTAAAFTHA